MTRVLRQNKVSRYARIRAPQYYIDENLINMKYFEQVPCLILLIERTYFIFNKTFTNGPPKMDVVSISKLRNSISSPFMQLLCLARRVRAQEAAFPLFIYPDASSSTDRDLEHPRTRPCPAQLCCTHTNKEDHTYF